MLKKYFSLIALFIAIAITLYFIFFFFINMRMFSSTKTSNVFPASFLYLPNDTAFGGIFAHIQFNDSLPYYEYKRKEDSLNRITQAMKFNNKGQIGTSISMGFLGVCTMIDEVADGGILEKEKPDKGKHYYLELVGYNLDRDTKFYIHNDTYNLAYAKWDSIRKGQFGSTKIGHYESKQIKVRYASYNKSILIPISKKQYHFFIVSLNILIYLIIFFIAYIFIGLPIQILIRISKGDAFNGKNIQSFKMMSIVLFIYISVFTFGPYLLKFIFRKIIPTDFEFQFVSQTFLDNIYPCLTCLCLFFISKAFKKGYQLQKEQDLTI